MHYSLHEKCGISVNFCKAGPPFPALNARIKNRTLTPLNCYHLYLELMNVSRSMNLSTIITHFKQGK